jgi:methionyl-tRNA formyltransferase
MNPWPAAHTFLPTPAGLRQLKIFGCSLPGSEYAAPGEVLRTDGQGIFVSAQGGAILLNEIQLEGKRRMPAGEFLRGHPIAPGTILG